jgi:hypothetical protein
MWLDNYMLFDPRIRVDPVSIVIVRVGVELISARVAEATMLAHKCFVSLSVKVSVRDVLKDDLTVLYILCIKSLM